MTDLISDGSQPELRKVTLAGDARSRPDQKTQRDAHFFWVLSATAPYFGRQHAFDRFGKRSGVNADHVYPLRVLTADQPRAGKAGGPPWRRPRLVDLHLLVGASNEAYAESSGRVDRLMLAFSETSRIDVRARGGNVLQSFPEESRPRAGRSEDKAPFVRTVAELLPPGDDQWPPPDETSKAIPVPPMRLVAGCVGLRAALIDASGKPTSELAWLRKLGIHSERDGKADWARIWLVPDGIEFDAVFDTFPGSSGQTLRGRVKLSADDNGAFFLDLLSVTAGSEGKWRDAWSRITPAVRDDNEDYLLGLKFAASHGDGVPGFRWPVTMQGGRPSGLGLMQIPQSALRLELVSPSESGEIDGVAKLSTGWVSAEDVGDKVAFKFGAKPTTASPSVVMISCSPKSIQADFGALEPLAVQVDQLAADLRAAYDLEDPPVVPSAGKGSAAGAAFGRPLIPAFVPMVDGWLQLPVPNLGPLDTGHDINLTAPQPRERKPSLFGDGFFRLKRLARPASVLTVGGQFDSGSQAPWVLTIDRPTALHGVVEIVPGRDPAPLAGAPAAGGLSSAVISVYDFNLSARGLVWMSVDRPDVFEALPRLGAGPGSFIDLAFESGSADLLRVGVSALAIKATRRDHRSACEPPQLNDVDLAIDFNAQGKRWVGEILRPEEAQAALREAVAVIDGESAAKAVAASLKDSKGALPWSPVMWRRHHSLPLAATMPMTRAAAGAVRPLESRDLIPFALETRSAGLNWQRLATLRLSAGQPFAVLSDAGLRYRLASSWPNEPGADGSGNPERGIAFAALGLPGVELRPISSVGSPETIAYQASLRFDLPALDEAFATAPLPPQPGRAASEGEQEVPPPRPVATALDWPLLAEMWKAQERKHQNARVADSYMMPFKTVDAGADQSKVDVKTLVKGLAWGGIGIQVGTRSEPGKLPYGKLSIDGAEAVSGNDVLRGLDGGFTPDLGTRTLRKDGGPLTVLGSSPATFRAELGPGAEGYVDLDNRLTGITPPAEIPVGILSRSVKLPNKDKLRLISLLAPMPVRMKAPGQAAFQQNFLFWFKDVLFEGDQALIGARDGAIAFDVWDDEELLAGSGFEWRLVPAQPIDAEAAFGLGRNQMPFFGFRLEPLRLQALSLRDDAVESASILCRLTLGEPERSPDPALNLLTLKLTLNPDGEALDASFESTPEQAPLRFSFAIAEASGRDRRVAVEARIVSGDDATVLKVSRFAIAVAGVDVAFSAAEISFSPRMSAIGAETVSFTAGCDDETVPAGAGRLRIVQARLTAGLALRDAPARLSSIAPELELKYAVEIVPRGETPSSATGMLSFERSLDPLHPGSLSLFGWRAALPAKAVQEGDETIALALTAVPIAETGWRASLGLVARLKTDSDPHMPTPALTKTAIEGTVELVLGHCDADLAPVAEHDTIKLGAAGIAVTEARVRFALSKACAKASDYWKGTATVSGTVTAKNAINWPSVGWTSPATIPLPREPKENNGRVRVTPGQARATTHGVTWVFSDHRLDLALAAALAQKAGAALWTTLVTARHELSRGARTLRWVGVETIAIGSPEAMVPRLPVDLGTDSTTFAARYKGRIERGDYVQRVEPGMHRPGLGAVATVLQGTLGAAFRTAFWKQPREGLMVMGGFLGALRLGAGSAAPLLRLPVLAGLGAGQIGQTVPPGGVELAWADGPATRLLALTRPGTPSPADTSLDALHAAVLAGSLPPPPSGDGARLDDPVGSVLIEQSYVNEDLAATATLETTPFFLASAIAVERLFREPWLPGPIEALSLVAGASAFGKDGKASRSLSLAAALALRDKDVRPSPPLPLRRWALVGEGLSLSDWTGPSLGESDATPVPALTGLAVARDRNPRAAFVAMSLAAEGHLARYVAHAFSPMRFDAPAAPVTPDGSFADHGRGPMANAADEEPLRWLAPVVEGPAGPIRDFDEDTNVGSGVAGLTRRTRLPASTGEALDVNAEQAADDFVWVAQTQIPIYLPLQIKSLKGPSLGWLTPAAPLVRLPVSGDVLQAVRAGDDGAVSAGPKRRVQPFLPEELSAASVGERAGIMTARRARLLGGVGAAGRFDPIYARFGRPAQSGSSFARYLRTPRPARLPANTGDALRDRRTQASSVEVQMPLAAVIGSADAVEGVGIAGNNAAWSIQVVAAPEWESTVSDLWDGTLRLACRIVVVSDAGPALAPRDLLGHALIAGTASQLDTRAVLRIGHAIVPFSHARFRTTQSWSPHSVHPKAFCAEIEVILTPKGATPGLPSTAIATAFSVLGSIPAVEFQWTVHPSSRRAINVVGDGNLPLTVVDTASSALARGVDRAPVTLRMPLYPVTALRGALPLTPATLLFVDPAYDRDLAGPPAGDGRILELTESARKLLPGGRGDLKLQLTADRAQLNRLGTITFMLDVRFERPMDDIAQAIAEQAGAASAGDLMSDQEEAAAQLRLVLQPKGGAARPLRFGNGKVEIKLGDVYELPLSAVTEADGSPARLSAGDVLVLEAALSDNATAVFWHSASGAKTAPIDLLPAGKAIPSCSLNLVLTDDPVIEPPPALYAALLRTGDGAATRLSVPLHAQSPLPFRVDLVDPARDFRKGMMRRHACFVWPLVRPRAEFANKCVYVIKADRNGQTYLPEDEGEFLRPAASGPPTR